MAANQITPISLSLIGKSQIIQPFLNNISLLRKRILTARGNQQQSNLDALIYILSPNPGTLVDKKYSGDRLTVANNVVRAKLNWKSLYP